MKIRMLDSESTRVEGVAFHYLCGREYDLPEKIARVWITKRLAEPVEGSKKPQKKEE